MIPVKEAETITLNLVQPFNPLKDTEIVKLENATGRILAYEIASKVDFPYWDNSAMVMPYAIKMFLIVL
jgi:molybdopterin molybdotransferase